jgi:tryptophan 2,3-dioxygenase
MHEPALWNDDPRCGHLVAQEHQTHYCTYTRVPKLLTLQRAVTDHPDEILAILALQAIELWLKVISTDLEAAIAELAAHPSTTYQLTKLLHRSSKLIQLLDGHVEVAESIVVHDLALQIPLSGPMDDLRSAQLRRTGALTEQLIEKLDRHEQADDPSLRIGRIYIKHFQYWSDRYQRLTADLFVRDHPGAPALDQYLALEDLLNLHDGAKADWATTENPPQRLLRTEAPSPDELMFIVVHQVFELWFLAMIHELEAVLDNLNADSPEIHAASYRLRHVIRIQQLLVGMIHAPATMLPMDFLTFREQTKTIDGTAHQRGLSPASGTESYQFRELEVMAGLRDNEAYSEFLNGNPNMHIRFMTPDLERRLQRPSLSEAFMRVVEARGFHDLADIFQPANHPNPHADLGELADLLLEFDKLFQLWRVNHLTMVQSMIGRKSGTGFLGPEYLRETVGMGAQGADNRLLRTSQVRPRFFEELWEVRTRLQVEPEE